MKYQLYFDLMSSGFSWNRCLNNVERIYETDHWFRNSSFLKTAAFCEQTMREAGLEQVEQLPLKADGKTAYGGWVISRAWDARSAWLTVADEPETVLADYEAVPCSLCMYSAGTPVEGVSAPVVQIDDLSEIPDVRGKIIFTGLAPKTLVPVAVQGGALGIVTDFIPLVPGVRDSVAQMTGVSRWENDLITPKNDTGLFAFSLSPENGAELRRRIRENPDLRLTANVDAGEDDGVLPTISGCIPGREPELEEILIYGHLYEPGANDNASGCAVILEVARCLAEAIAEGRMPRPRRTIRFAMGHECGGSTGYLVSHPERKACLAVIADMVGTEAVDNARLSIWHNPLTGWSFMDSALIDLLNFCRDTYEPSFDWEERPFAVGTDNMLGDPCWSMPTIALITEPALSYHSSMDTPDRIEESVMARNAMVLGTFAMLCADLSAEDAALKDLIRAHGKNLWDETEEKRALRENALRRAEEEFDCLVSGGGQPAFRDPPVPQHEEAARIPVRLVPGCLTFADRPSLKDCEWQPAWNTELNLPLFWADGKRSLWEIACLSGWEEGDSDIAARYRRLSKYFDVLAEHGYIHWK